MEIPSRLVTREIVGVIRQVKMRPDDLPENALEVYVPVAQNPWSLATLVVRTVADPMMALPAIRAAVARIDATQVIANPRTMDDVASAATARPRFRAQVVTAFATIAVLLSAIGIFSVLMFAVQQRAREFSIRLALGARPSAILRIVVASGLKVTGVGIAVGLIGTVAVTRLVATLLFGVPALDPMMFAIVPVVVTIVATVACLIPAVRAAQSNPAVALRGD